MVRSKGALAGRVLIEIARASGKAITVRGWGARVPIYGHVADRPWDVLVDAIARATAMERLTQRDESLLLVDEVEAVQIKRSRVAARTALLAVETRVIPVIHARDMARVVRLALSCRGKVIGAPQRSYLVVSDIRSHLDRIEKLAPLLAAGKRVSMELPHRRKTRYGVADRSLTPCKTTASELPPPLKSGRANTAGSAAGEILCQLARARRTDLLVGCGGDRPVYYLPPPGATLEHAARALQLWRIDKMVFTSADMAHKHKLRRQTDRSVPKLLLRSFSTRYAHEVTQVAEASFGERVFFAEAFLPKGLIVAVGTPVMLEMLARLIDAWNRALPKNRTTAR